MVERSLGGPQWLPHADKGSDCILKECDPGEVLNEERGHDDCSTARADTLCGLVRMIDQNVRSPMRRDARFEMRLCQLVQRAHVLATRMQPGEGSAIRARFARGPTESSSVEALCGGSVSRCEIEPTETIRTTMGQVNHVLRCSGFATRACWGAASQGRGAPPD